MSELYVWGCSWALAFAAFMAGAFTDASPVVTWLAFGSATVSSTRVYWLAFVPTRSTPLGSERRVSR